MWDENIWPLRHKKLFEISICVFTLFICMIRTNIEVQSRAMQYIIFDEICDDHFLSFDEAFFEEHEFSKMLKVGFFF
jgi:hypothetical protein